VTKVGTSLCIGFKTSCKLMIHNPISIVRSLIHSSHKSINDLVKSFAAHRLQLNLQLKPQALVSIKIAIFH